MLKLRDLIFILPFLIFSIWIFQEDFSNYKIKLLIAENLFFTIIIFSLYKLFEGKTAFVLFYSVLYLKTFLHLFYVQKYGELPGASIVYILVETNFQEILEYLESNFTIDFGILLLIYFSSLFVLIKLYKKTGYKLIVPILILMTIVSYAYYKKDLIKYNIIGTIYTGIFEYRDYKKTLENNELKNAEGYFTDVYRVKNDNQEIHVLVIGESTTRHRMELYGYPRPNNPKLKTIKDELYLNKNSISPHTYTIESLTQALLIKDGNPNKKSSIIQMMNQSGFETFWISNQRPVGIFESLLTIISTASHTQSFLNLSDYHAQTPHDEILIPEFKKVIENSVEDIFVVLHLMGTHSSYHRRYPLEFAKFTGKPPQISYEGAEVFQTVSEYDNAILYNDFVIFNLINELKKTDANSYLLYISDHGEDVFQVNKSASHSVGKGTKPMYDIPFMLWSSKDFLEKRDLVLDPERPVSITDLGYIIAHLSGVRFKSFREEKSVFSENYKDPNRMIFNNQNYDSIFKNNKN